MNTIDAIKAVVEHYIDEERRDYEDAQMNGLSGDNHIFLALAQLEMDFQL